MNKMLSVAIDKTSKQRHQENLNSRHMPERLIFRQQTVGTQTPMSGITHVRGLVISTFFLLKTDKCHTNFDESVLQR